MPSRAVSWARHHTVLFYSSHSGVLKLPNWSVSSVWCFGEALMESNSKPNLATPCLYKCLVTGSSFFIFPMHHTTVFLAILFASGTVSASAFPQWPPAQPCLGPGSACYPGQPESYSLLCCGQNNQGTGMAKFLCFSGIHSDITQVPVVWTSTTNMFVVPTPPASKTRYMIVCSICIYPHKTIWLSMKRQARWPESSNETARLGLDIPA